MHPLLALGLELRQRGYFFAAITPESHRRILERTNFRVTDPLRGIFGWNRPFARTAVDPVLFELLESANCIARCDDSTGLYKSRVRFSTLRAPSGDAALFVHSSFPTDSNDAVFFGPDTYRYVQFVQAQLELETPARFFARAIDLGTGSGAGGLMLQSFCGEMMLSDVNALALDYANINEALNPFLKKSESQPGAAANVTRVKSDLFASISGDFDLIIANPPFIQDNAKRAYRDGGGEWGAGLSIRIVRESLKRLSPAGKLMLYTASPIHDGKDVFFDSIRADLEGDFTFTYKELDPDIFGEELANPAYHEIDRIAAVGLVVKRHNCC
jgi:release factor glutamine methyltransferase